VGRFRTDESGSTAVEFSLVAVPFFGLMFAILETALAFFAQSVLDEAVATAARSLRTGQAQQAGLTAQTFKDSICVQLVDLFDCQGGLYVDVSTAASFAAISLTVPVDVVGNLKTSGYNYTPNTKGGDIVVVRAYYQWPVFVNRLGNDLANMPNGTHLIVGTAAFRNEPFPW
jgi:Flp pilus assembly protein TadG